MIHPSQFISPAWLDFRESQAALGNSVFVQYDGRGNCVGFDVGRMDIGG